MRNLNMGCKQSYLPSPEENNRQALVHNLQDDIMDIDEFKASASKLPLSDTGLNLVFAYSFADKVVQQMTEHNASNYQVLLNDALTAMDILNCELDRIIAAAKENLPADQILGPVIDATHHLSGFHPVLRFCDERDLKGVIERVEELIDSLLDTIMKVESIRHKNATKEDAKTVDIH